MGYFMRINMTERKIAKQPVPPAYKDLGGRGLISEIICAEVPPSCHPLGENNKCVLAPGPFAGTPFPCSGRLSIGGKSPLTGGIKESNAGGTVAWKLSRLGISAIIIEGLPPQGTNIFLLRLSRDGNHLIPGGEYERMGTYTLADALRKRFGDHISIVAVGPAGEMMLSAAGVAVTSPEGHPCDYAGRGGMGAVLGSKKIKAVIIDDKGAQLRDKFYNREEFTKLSKAFANKLLTTKKDLRKYGTPLEVSLSNELGYLPTRNYQSCRFEGTAKISGEAMHELIQTRGGKSSGRACMPGCPIRCKQTYLDIAGEYLTSGLEYETIVMLGSNCGIDDFDAIARMDRICDDYGLDTIEMGAAIGVVMEAGVLSFGDTERAISLLEEIPRETFLGRIVGNGAAIAGKVFSVRRTPAVKGQSLAGYDPRANKGIGVTYISSAMGADHTAGCVIPGRTGFDPNKKYDLLKPDGQEELSLDLQTMVAVIDAMGVCFFVGIEIETLHTLAKVHHARFGSEMTFGDLVKLGKKILNNEHTFNLAAGVTPVHHLPEFLETEALSPHGTVFDVSIEKISKDVREKLNVSTEL